MLLKFTTDAKLSLLIFCLLMSYYVAVSSPHIHNDSVYYYSLTESIAVHHDYKFRMDIPGIDKIQGRSMLEQGIRDAHTAMGKQFNSSNPQPIEIGADPIILSTVGALFYYVAVVLSLPPEKFVPFITNPIITSLTAVVIFSFSNKLFNSRRIGVILAMFFGMTSFVVPWTSEFYTRSTVALITISSLYFIYLSKQNKNPLYSFFGGLLAPSIFLGQPAQFLSIPPIMAYGILLFRKDKRMLSFFVLGMVLVVGLFLSWNFVRYGSPTSFGYDYGPSSNAWSATLKSFVGLYGFWVSPGWSVFIYYPLAILFPVSFYLLYRKDKLLTITFSLIVLLTWLYYGVNTFWTGYGGWGPRYLIPLLPLFTVASGAFISKFSSRMIWKIFLIFLAASGFIINLLGRLVWFMTGYSIWWNALSLNISKYSDLDWNPMWSPIVNHFKVATSDWVPSRWPSPGSYDYGTWMNQLYPNCRYDLMFYCTYGVLPLILLTIAMIAFSYFIVKILKISEKITQ